MITVRNINNLDVTTTKGEAFTGPESARLCFLIAKRFGFNYMLAAQKYREMLQNSCSDSDFGDLVEIGAELFRYKQPVSSLISTQTGVLINALNRTITEVTISDSSEIAKHIGVTEFDVRRFILSDVICFDPDIEEKDERAFFRVEGMHSYLGVMINKALILPSDPKRSRSLIDVTWARQNVEFLTARELVAALRQDEGDAATMEKNDESP